MTDLESNLLIDWSGPAIEYMNKPLIPLPSSNNPIDIAEDNPFDVVERQVNENELLDIFNINMSFGNESKCEAIHEIPENAIVECGDEVLNHENYFINEDCADKNSLGTSPKKCENDELLLDTSFISDFSSLSDFKEMIQSRISCCMNQAFSSEHQVKNSLSEKDNFIYSPQTLNNSFIQRSDESKDSEILKNFEGECEDLQSIKLNWDDYIMSSSDEENEKLVEKPKPFCYTKKMPVRTVEKIKDVRAPLISQDPNIRIKKSNVISKQGPLKATIPVSNVKKMEDQKSKLMSTSTKIITSSKLKIKPTTQSKLKKWSSPVATSTPQNSKTSSPSYIQRSLISNPSPTSSIHKANKTFSHPPSPDSTTDLIMSSRSISVSRITPKNYSKNASSDLVSSSTKDSSKYSFKATKDGGVKSIARNLRNKENLKPFRN